MMDEPLRNTGFNIAADDTIDVDGKRHYLSAAIRQQEWVLLFYGDTPNSFGVIYNSRFLICRALNSETVRCFYDFSNYTYAPENRPDDMPYVEQELIWAQIRDNVLYVSHAHHTYSDSSMGKNAYITAIDMTSGRVVWRSGPRVANAQTFEIIGDVLVCGYGFTEEDDYLVQLNRWTGEELHRTPVKSAPEWIFTKGDRLLVRCYDRDYQFAVLDENAGLVSPVDIL